MPTPVPRPAHLNGQGSRRGQTVDLIVLHTTEGTAAGALAWFADPRAKVASHYVIGPDGAVYSCVTEARAAWHAGHLGVNLRSIGIECAGHCDDPATWTAPLVESLIDLVVDICRRYPAVHPSRSAIIGHAEVPDPVHPGKFGGAGNHEDPGVLIPWDHLIGEVQRRLAPSVAGFLDAGASAPDGAAS